MTGDAATLQAGYVPLAPHRAAIAGQPAVVALPVPRPYGHGERDEGRHRGSHCPTRSARSSVAAQRERLDGHRARAARRARAGPGAPRLPAVPALHALSASDVTRPTSRRSRRAASRTCSSAAAPSTSAKRSRRAAHRARRDRVARRRAVGVRHAARRRSSRSATRSCSSIAHARIGALHPFRVPRRGCRPAHERRGRGARAAARSCTRGRNHRPVADTIEPAARRHPRARGFVLLAAAASRRWPTCCTWRSWRGTYEAAGGLSFRGFVRAAARGGRAREAPEAPIVEEGSEGVRMMTVHKAKGLEFPVVILADITARHCRATSQPLRGPARGLCALRLAGWAAVGSHRARERRDARAIAPRACAWPMWPRRARATCWWSRRSATIRSPSDGTERPTAGSGRSTAPSIRRPSDRRAPHEAAGCPAFGEDSVLERPDRDTPGRDNVSPGLHAFGSDRSGYGVVWWDPRRLGLDGPAALRAAARRPRSRTRARPIVERDRARYDQWLAERRAAQERGAQPSIRLRTATDWARSRRDGDDRAAIAREVELVAVTRPLPDRRAHGSGRSFTRRWRPSPSTRRPRRSPRA